MSTHASTRRDRARDGQARARCAFAAAAMIMGAGGCLAPEAAAPTIAAQREALLRLERASAEDHAALRAAVGALLGAQRERLLARIEQEIVGRFMTAQGGADLAALDEALRAGAAPGALIGEIRRGRATRDEIAALLTDYGAAEGLSDARAYRRGLLGAIGVVRDHDAAAGAALAALEARAGDTARLFAEALDSNAALRDGAGAMLEPDLAAREAALVAWRMAIVSRLREPSQRESAERLARTLLNLFTTEPTVDTLAALPEAR